MSIVTVDPHAWFVAIDEDGNRQTVINCETDKHNYPFGFEVNYSDKSVPSQNTVTLYNMSEEHRNFYQKKQKCYVAFNWGEEKKILAEGYITKTSVPQSDGVTDSFVIYFSEGTNYSNLEARKLKTKKKKKVNRYKTVKKYVPGHYEKKRIHYYTMEDGKKVGHYKYQKVYVKAKTANKRVKTRATRTYYVNKTYKKGTTYKKIIEGVANQAGIKISKIQLAKNPKIKKSFTAKGKPLNLLKQLVKPTGSNLVYIKGKLVITDPKSTKRTWYVITDDDLKIPPTYNEDSDDDKGTWEITTPLIPEFTLNVGVKMDSRFLKGKFYIKAGKHTNEADDPTSTSSIKPM